jgi:flavin reductase (DIM6/NTAB) family NADH-FMN oxidoreductase RutF
MPILEGTCGWLECTIIAEVELGDRFLYVAEITAKGAVSTSDTPLQLNDAFSRLPKDVVQALDQKHNKDMLRDEDLVKRFPQS